MIYIAIYIMYKFLKLLKLVAFMMMVMMMMISVVQMPMYESESLVYGYERNNILKAIAIQHTATQGLFLSPVNRQNQEINKQQSKSMCMFTISLQLFSQQKRMLENCRLKCWPRKLSEMRKTIRLFMLNVILQVEQFKKLKNDFLERLN